MKMYEPKLNLGDSVWVMQNNKPTQLSVVGIEVSCYKETDGETAYTCKYELTGGHTLLESTKWCPGDFIFTTKNELIRHLYENS